MSSSFLSVRRALSAVTLFVALANAQQCYYPDGTPSDDTPCSSEDGVASCCGENSFCMDNGLCFGGGLVSRGSCTDKSWDSEACTGFCKTDDTHTNITLKPCSSSTFVCGLEASCTNQTALFSLSATGTIVLRPSQIETLAKSAVSSLEASISATSTSTSAPNPALYTSGQMAGLGVGLGIPLLLSLIACYLLYRRRTTTQPKQPKLMYKLPDNHNDFEFPRPPVSRDQAAPPWSLPVSRDSDVGSLRTVGSLGDLTPVHMQSFFERYQEKKAVGAVELPAGPIVHEMGDGKGVKR